MAFVGDIKEFSSREPITFDRAMDELRRLPRSKWLDLARSDQSHRWRGGQHVAVEEYFNCLPELRTSAEEAVVLISGEVHLRRELGEAPSTTQYQARFPEFADRIALQFHVDEFLSSSDGEPSDGPGEIGDLELPGYEFLERLGSGASGVVYRARQLPLDRFVAIKALPMASADAKQLARQRQEAEILARLNHKNVVHIYEVREYRGCAFLVMEFVEGTTLAERANQHLLTPTESARLTFTLAETVQAVHEAGILHRDLKPSNVLISSTGEPKITDFGLAKLRTSGSQLTTADSVLGTPSYMAPELAAGDARLAGPAADVYSLGAILYELLTGRAPFLGATVLDTLVLIRTQEPAAPRMLQPDVPRDLETICLHCLNKNPSSRYATAANLAADVRRFLDGVPIVARRTTAAERLLRWSRRNPAVASLTAAVAALLVAAVAILLASNAGIRREAAAKDAALVTARQAVDQMLLRVADERLSEMPRAHPLREAMLKDALRFYEGFLAQAEDDAAVRENMATILNGLGVLQRELGRPDEACRTLQRSVDLLTSIAPADPQPPAIREKLVAAHEALAYTWEINPADRRGRQADKQYRQTLDLYAALQRDYPDRRQPTTLCLRRLGDLAYQREEYDQARRYWRQAIDEGEAYLLQQPGNADSRCTLCWACANLADALLVLTPQQAPDAEPILRQGLKHAALVLEQDPQSSQIREVTAYLHLRLARCYELSDRMDDAVGLYRQAAEGIESLCTRFPWNPQFWDNANYIHRQVIENLRAGGRTADADAALTRMTQWADAAAGDLPDDPASQAGFRRCREALAALLRRSPPADESASVDSRPDPKAGD